MVSGIIEWPLPPVLLLKTWQKVGSSINMEVMNYTETVVMKVRMIGLGNNGSYLNRINPPLSPYMSAYLSVLLVPLFFVFSMLPTCVFFFFFFFFFQTRPKGTWRRGRQGEGARRKRRKKLTLTLPLPYFDASTSRSIESPNLSHSREEGAYSALEIELIVNFNQ